MGLLDTIIQLCKGFLWDYIPRNGRGLYEERTVRN